MIFQSFTFVCPSLQFSQQFPAPVIHLRDYLSLFLRITRTQSHWAGIILLLELSDLWVWSGEPIHQHLDYGYSLLAFYQKVPVTTWIFPHPSPTGSQHLHSCNSWMKREILSVSVADLQSDYMCSAEGATMETPTAAAGGWSVFIGIWSAINGPNQWFPLTSITCWSVAAGCSNELTPFSDL